MEIWHKFEVAWACYERCAKRMGEICSTPEKFVKTRSSAPDGLVSLSHWLTCKQSTWLYLLRALLRFIFNLMWFYTLSELSYCTALIFLLPYWRPWINTKWWSQRYDLNAIWFWGLHIFLDLLTDDDYKRIFIRIHVKCTYYVIELLYFGHYLSAR